MEHFIDRYGGSWTFKRHLKDFHLQENVVKLSELKKGECFSPPFKSNASFKLSDGNLYFNLHGYKEHPHTIEHEDPDALVTKRNDLVWDFEKNTFTRLSN
jgi:hypothetical protein